MGISASQIRVEDIDHLGIVAGIIDEMGLFEQINQLLGTHPQETSITIETQRAGRFILATNVLEIKELKDEDVLGEYKAQKSTELSFQFLKDPLFLTSTVFLNSRKRVKVLWCSLS